MDSVNKKNAILKPLLSEKSLSLYRLNKICTCLVDTKATKKEIGYVFEMLYNIKPTAIRTVVSRDVRVVRNRKTYRPNTKRRYVKKAYIAIGDNTFDLYENIK